MCAASATRMSHDFRSALGIVMGNAELLHESGPLSPRQQKFAERILEASREMLAILDGSGTVSNNSVSHVVLATEKTATASLR